MNNKPVSECNKEEEMKKIAETWDKEASKGLEKDWREEFDEKFKEERTPIENTQGEYTCKVVSSIKNLKSFISQIESSAYKEGYKQGKFDAEADKEFNITLE